MYLLFGEINIFDGSSIPIYEYIMFLLYLGLPKIFFNTFFKKLSAQQALHIIC